MAPVKKKKPAPVKKAVIKKAPKKAAISKPKPKAAVSKSKVVIKSKLVPKTVAKKAAPAPAARTSGSKGEVVPKVLTGEGERRRRIADLKNKR